MGFRAQPPALNPTAPKGLAAFVFCVGGGVIGTAPAVTVSAVTYKPCETHKPSGQRPVSLNPKLLNPSERSV